jgi:hypothetical protein
MWSDADKVHCCATIAADLEGDHLHVGSVTGEYVQRALDRLQLGEVDGRGALGLIRSSSHILASTCRLEPRPDSAAFPSATAATWSGPSAASLT